MLRQIYRALWWLIAPVAVIRLYVRSRRERGYREHICERFGAVAGRPADDRSKLIWLHAVSVGETRAAQPLIEALLAEHPQARILLTHMTPGGRATGETLFGERVLRCYLPYDMPWAVRRFLRAYRPVLGIVMETEVWPTLIDECRRMAMPLTLVNARMSQRSYRRADRFGAAAREVFGGFTRVLAQSPADATRLNALGAREVAVLGNLKFDMSAPESLIERGRTWRTALKRQHVWVAASTREGEEALVLDAARGMAGDEVLLILVPRHPQRFDEVAALLEREGWRYSRRSTWNEIESIGRPHSGEGPVQVVLGDSMGELAAYYAAADAAFIGGSLLPLGGQNLIEACVVGTPVLFGPHMFNFTQASTDALAAGAAIQVQDTEGLASALKGLFDDPSRQITMSGAASAFAARHRGATARTVAVLSALLR
ncbi:lipid IV(A) 3-deoxy-D-manno-octulosonic acid transferase [Pararobbsia alpina]|uniref:3-deoxy-D-manno-octulosonic acid transferase n=1 Tax=Pararobbsia alpina TaxID=621374 RepID=A0A6S7B9Y8_9BURK|nr:lipid IV(A) 3-deoxy-D-manno-octulosonic acid transferase [Pararobbsia alpina]CAB3781946.1 3-deoxy-D-manno-octulosonic acid transferase [Pararobbsia alpina]